MPPAVGVFALAPLIVVLVLAVNSVRQARAEAESREGPSTGRQPICNEPQAWNIWLLG